MYLVVLSLDTVEEKQPLKTYETFKAAFCSLKIREAVGMYKGQYERSLIVEIPDEDFEKEFHFLELVAKEFNQECVLVVHPNNMATLVYPGSNMTHIGTWTKCENVQHETKDDALTIDLTDMSIYKCVG